MARKSWVLALFLAVTLTAGCSSEESAGISSMARNRMVVIGVSPFAAPLLYQRGQEWVGPEAELANRIVEKIHDRSSSNGNAGDLETIWAGMDYEGLASSIASKEVNLIVAAYGITDDRKETMSFSNSYYTSKLVLAVNPVQEVDPQDLSGVSIGVRAASAVEQFVRDRFPNSTVAPFKTLDDAVLALKRGEIGGVIDDQYILAYSLDTMPGVGYLEIIPEPLGTIDVAIAVPKDDPELLKLVNGVVDQVKKEQLYSQWMGEETAQQLERVAGRRAARLEGERLAAEPRLVRIQISKDTNYDFDIYRMANLPFELTEESSGERYTSSKIDFKGSVGSSSVRVPPGSYRILMKKMNNWSPGSVTIQPSDPKSITVRIRLLQGGQVRIQRS